MSHRITKIKNHIWLTAVALVVVLGVVFIAQVRNNPDIFSLSDPLAKPVFAASQAPTIIIDTGTGQVYTLEELQVKDLQMINAKDKEIKDYEFNIILNESGQPKLEFNPTKGTFRPGRYTVQGKIETPDGIRDFSQDFYWGVLAINMNKSVYLPNEQAYLQMAVLSDTGDTLCGSKLSLKIQDTRNKIQTLSTEDGTIIMNPECGPNNVIDTPDYYAYYKLEEEGIYQLLLTAETPNGTRSIKDFIEVKKSLPFEIERIGPTRIYPRADYAMRVKIKANEDFEGYVTEYVPESFKVYDSTDDSRFTRIEDPRESAIIRDIQKLGQQPLVWQVDFKKDEAYELSYKFDAPDISPEFYLLGPLAIGEWQEARHWQVASDALTVVFAKNNTEVEINAAEDTMTSVTGFASANYFLFGGTGNLTVNAAGDRNESHIGTAADTPLAGTQELQEGPDADDRWAYFAMTRRLMDSGDTIYVQADDEAGAGEGDEAFIMGIATSTMGTFGTDYFWADDPTDDTGVGTDISTEPDHSSITFTPDGTSQYLFIASAQVDTTTAEEYGEMRIIATNGVTSMVNHIRDGEDTSDTPLLFAATTTIPANLSTTYSVRVAGESGSSIDYLHSSLLIIRLNYYQDFSCVGDNDNTAIGTTPTVMATTNLTLTSAGDVIALYFGGFTSGTQANEVSLRAREGANIRFQLTEADTNNEEGRNAVWETSDVHNLLWFDNITISDTDSHTYDLAMEASSNGPNSEWAMVCVWSEAEWVAATDPTIATVTDSPDPVCEGCSITFSTDWSDPNSDPVKVKVCRDPAGLTNQVCDNGTFASSTVFTLDDPEDLYYNLVSSDTGTVNYHVYVCDDGASCSTVTSQDFTVTASTPTIFINQAEILKKVSLLERKGRKLYVDLPRREIYTKQRGN